MNGREEMLEDGNFLEIPPIKTDRIEERINAIKGLLVNEITLGYAAGSAGFGAEMPEFEAELFWDGLAVLLEKLEQIR